MRCFLVEETDRETRSLRRWSGPGHATAACPGPLGYHNAERPWLEDAPSTRDANGFRLATSVADGPPLDSPEWPTTCDHCAHVFGDQDHRQIATDTWYLADDGRRWPKRKLPAGAMYDATWMHGIWTGADGRSLVVILPNGVEWSVDVPTQDGTPWTRTGEPPHVTANPSILAHGDAHRPKYHGFLRNGVLEPCSDSAC